MTNKDLLLQEIENLPPELVNEALDLIRSIKIKHTEPNTKSLEKLTYRPASGRSILRHAGTWEGDDFEECLQSVINSRGKAKFDYDNPFE